MDWKRHETDDGVLSWTKTFGDKHIVVGNTNRYPYPYTRSGRTVGVWVSAWADDLYPIDEVHLDWTIEAAKAWAEKEYS